MDENRNVRSIRASGILVSAFCYVVAVFMCSGILYLLLEYLGIIP